MSYLRTTLSAARLLGVGACEPALESAVDADALKGDAGAEPAKAPR